MSFELEKFTIGGKEIGVVDNTAREQIVGLQPKADSSLTTADKTVVGGINELNIKLSNKQDKTDNALNTADKTVVGAINELGGELSNKLLIEQHTNTIQVSVPAQSYTYYDTGISFIKEGYELIGTFFIDAAGGGWTYIIFTPYRFDNKIIFNLYNPTSAMISLTGFNFKTVWIKTS